MIRLAASSLPQAARQAVVATRASDEIGDDAFHQLVGLRLGSFALAG
jgi:hypothetical protein